MKIALDFRGLLSGKISGVENYIFNVIERVLQKDKTNEYLILENSSKKKDFTRFKFINAKIVQRKIPNKIFNMALMLGFPKFEKYFPDFDLLFMPNINFFSIKPNTKLILTVHDLSFLVAPSEYFDFKRRLWHKLVRFKSTVKRADKIIAVSEYTKQDLIKFCQVPPEKITVVYPGIDQQFFKPDLSEIKLREVRNIYGLPSKFVLYLNTIEPRKNLLNFLEAYQRLPDDTALVIGGKKGWKYRHILQALNKSSKKRLIKYLDYVPEEHKPYIIKLAKVVGYLSFYEGFGFPALEAMSVGTPVLVSNVTALPETVNNAALMVNPYDVDDIAEGLKMLLYDKDLREYYIEKGLSRAKDFNWQEPAEKVLKLFNSLN